MGVGFKDAMVTTVLVISIAGAQPRADALKISGRIEDRLPEPLANITVLLRLGESGNEVSKTQTDNAGRFEFAGVSPNAYEVVLQVPGFKSLTVPVSVAKMDVDVGTVVLDVADFGDPVAVPFGDPGGASEAHADSPIMTTLCDLLKSPLRFHKKIVQVHARAYPAGIDTGPSFVDETCSAWVTIGTPTEPLQRTYLNYLFGYYLKAGRGFEVTFTAMVELQLFIGERPSPYLRLQDVLDIGTVQARPTIMQRK
jgi:hypothetical protein